MKLSQFKCFLSEIRIDTSITELISEIIIYRKFDDKWYYENDEEVICKILITKLDKCLNITSPYKEKNSIEVMIYVGMLEAVVAAKFSTPPKKNKQLKLQENIAKCLEHSNNAYKATHDSLTGLLNKQAFNDKLELLASRLILEENGVGEILEITAQAPSLHVIAFDIDHFKQVNDNNGHLYGDIVLHLFAKRIEVTLKKETSQLSDVEVILARPGGEEFNIAIFGAVSEKTVIHVANQIRLAIAESPLPSDEEWKCCEKTSMTHSINLPHVSERKISTSIGISTLNESIKDIKQIAQSVKRILNQSDLALYKAKSSGRNNIKTYSQILYNCGRTLEHHKDTNILTIDIGKHIGVAIGQQFEVYHPDFTGDVPYIFSDGRTRKKLGIYPKFPVGIIEVFDVQNDISFCQIIKNDLTSSIPNGAILEAMPIGSISHLISQRTGDKTLREKDISEDRLQREILTAIDGGAEPVVVVFNIYDIENILKERGNGFVRDCLVNLFITVKELFPRTTEIANVALKNIVAVCYNIDKEEIEKVINTVIELADSKCSNIVKFTAGVFHHGFATVEIVGDKSNLDKRAALDFARFAASDKVVTDKNRIEFFTPKTSLTIMREWININNYQKGLADYNEFKSLGIKYSMIENRMSSLAFSNNLYKEALEFNSNSIELEQAAMFFANGGLIEYCLNNSESSYKYFTKAYELDNNFEMPDNYRFYYALASYDNFKSGMPVPLTDIKTAVERAKASQNHLDPLRIGTKVLDDIIDYINTSTSNSAPC